MKGTKTITMNMKVGEQLEYWGKELNKPQSEIIEIALINLFRHYDSKYSNSAAQSEETVKVS